MLHTVVKEQPNRPVTFIHAVRDEHVQAFKNEVENLMTDHHHINQLTVYSNPIDDRHLKRHETGYITKDWLEHNIRNLNSEFYFCGPTPFMESLVQSLTELGVTSDQVHYEFFGPKEPLNVPAHA